MALNVTTGDVEILHNRVVQIMTRDNSGQAVGVEADTENIANGTISSALLMYPVNTTPPTIARLRIDSKGGQQLRGSRTIPGTTFDGAQMVIDTILDLYRTLFISNSDLDITTFDNDRIQGANVNAPSVRNSMVIVSDRATDIETGEDFYRNICYLSAEHTISTDPRGGLITGNTVNPAPATIDLALEQGTYAPFGISLGDLTIDVENDSDILLYWDTIGVPTFTFYKDDGIATTVQLPYKPLDITTVTGKGGVKVVSEGVITAFTSVTANGLVTLAAPGTLADMWMFSNECQLQPTS